MTTYTPHQLTMEMGPMGPIGEDASLMLRVNRNCPWNKCLFCPVYKGSTFSVRGREEIKADINAAIRIRGLLESVSFAMGLNGRIDGEVIGGLVRQNPDVYGGPGGSYHTRPMASARNAPKCRELAHPGSTPRLPSGRERALC
jgi:hypothetical protein